MNVNTLVVSADEALRKLEQYRAIRSRQRTSEDQQVEALYASISKGARVLNLPGAFRQTGLNERGEPRLAVARADWGVVQFHPRKGPNQRDSWSTTDGAGGFRRAGPGGGWAQWNYQATAQNITLPGGTFDDRALARAGLSSPVPHIPPQCRPSGRAGLSHYFILFEVQDWKRYPVDPFLLRRVSGHLYVVEAEWELTELEASLFSAMRGGN